MKNRIKLLVVLAMLVLCVFVPICAFAAEPAVEGSDTTVVRITIDEPITVMSGGVDIQYDPNVLEIISADWVLNPVPIIKTIDKVNNKGVFAYAAPTTISGDVLYVMFRILDQAAYNPESVNTVFQLKDSAQQNIVVGEGGVEPESVWNEHNFIEKIHNDYIKEEATCTSKPIYYKSCSVCGIRNEETFVAGELAEHMYDIENADAAYLVSGANCMFKAIYKKSCVCGAAGVDTFEYGEIADHSYDVEKNDDIYLVSNATCTEKAVYKKSCVCGLASEDAVFEYGTELGHTGGSATCDAKAICERCGEPYGNYGHVYSQRVPNATYLVSEATCTEKAVYKRSCVCGMAGTSTFEYGNVLDHTFDKEVASDEYFVSAATCTVKATYKKSCVCGAAGDDIFEYGDILDHVYDKEVTTDTYRVSDATCTSAGVYKKSCVCGATGTEVFEYGGVTGHTWESTDEGTVCNVCGQQKAGDVDYSTIITIGIIAVAVIVVLGVVVAIVSGTKKAAMKASAKATSKPEKAENDSEDDE